MNREKLYRWLTMGLKYKQVKILKKAYKRKIKRWSMQTDVTSLNRPDLLRILWIWFDGMILSACYSKTITTTMQTKLQNTVKTYTYNKTDSRYNKQKGNLRMKNKTRAGD